MPAWPATALPRARHWPASCRRSWCAMRPRPRPSVAGKTTAQSTCGGAKTNDRRLHSRLDVARHRVAPPPIAHSSFRRICDWSNTPTARTERRVLDLQRGVMTPERLFGGPGAVPRACRRPSRSRRMRPGAHHRPLQRRDSAWRARWLAAMGASRIRRRAMPALLWACDSTPKVPFGDRHASMRRPSRVPLPSLIRPLSGRLTDAERTR
jgi:hypothetical protein